MGPPLVDPEVLAQQIGQVVDSGRERHDPVDRHRRPLIGPHTEHQVVQPQVAVHEGLRRPGHPAAQLRHGGDEPFALRQDLRGDHMTEPRSAGIPARGASLGEALQLHGPVDPGRPGQRRVVRLVPVP